MRANRTYYSGMRAGRQERSLVNIEKIGKGLRTSLPKAFGQV